MLVSVLQGEAPKEMTCQEAKEFACALGYFGAEDLLTVLPAFLEPMVTKAPMEEVWISNNKKRRKYHSRKYHILS